ncbi:MAG: NepR family anti-sigma factor [Pseudomonadota bacterium]
MTGAVTGAGIGVMSDRKPGHGGPAPAADTEAEAMAPDEMTPEAPAGEGLCRAVSRRPAPRVVEGPLPEALEAVPDDQREGELDADPLLARLRTLYDTVAREPLPDHLVTLLEKLDEAERNR